MNERVTMNRKMRKKNRKRLFSAFFLLAALLLSVTILKTLNSYSNATHAVPAANLADDTVESDSGRDFTVCLDPGHGEFDSGTTSISGVMEKDINLKVALKLGKLLESSGLQVVYTRKTDDIKGSSQKEDLQIRCDDSNQANADIFVSIHCNYDERSSKSKGLEVWCRFRGEKGDELAQSVEKQLAEAGYTRDRGIKYESDGGLFVLKNTKAVAVLVELGFLSNAEDSSYLESEKGQDACAQALSKAILDYAEAN